MELGSSLEREAIKMRVRLATGNQVTPDTHALMGGRMRSEEKTNRGESRSAWRTA
jgi:hypothetical protein